MDLNHGILLVSLDFELYWGVRDKRTISAYQSNLLGTKKAVSKILDVFEKKGIRATWATVGLLFCADRNEALARSPARRPAYMNKLLDPYLYLEGCDDIAEEFHFAPQLIRQIANVHGQEIATHTFSHYYCMEEGQSKADFEADLDAAIEVASDTKVAIKSMVFPRNQWNSDYLSVLSERGVLAFRGNEKSWLYESTQNQSQGLVRRALRLIDSYISLSGSNTYKIDDCVGDHGLMNFRSSSFLRPYRKSLRFLDWIRLLRIRRAMRNAAKKNEIFHIWWHPHNFGVDTDENLAFLSRVLEEYEELRERYGMKSMTMAELAAAGVAK
jgi:peptidoglycan/xylan/chitin deacetylase (PgdA/CDA1 family)